MQRDGARAPHCTVPRGLAAEGGQTERTAFISEPARPRLPSSRRSRRNRLLLPLTWSQGSWWKGATKPGQRSENWKHSRKGVEECGTLPTALRSPARPSRRAKPSAYCCYMPSFTNCDVHISTSQFDFFPQRMFRTINVSLEDARNRSS